MKLSKQELNSSDIKLNFWDLTKPPKLVKNDYPLARNFPLLFTPNAVKFALNIATHKNIQDVYSNVHLKSYYKVLKIH